MVSAHGRSVPWRGFSSLHRDAVSIAVRRAETRMGKDTSEIPNLARSEGCPAKNRGIHLKARRVRDRGGKDGRDGRAITDSIGMVREPHRCRKTGDCSWNHLECNSNGTRPQVASRSFPADIDRLQRRAMGTTLGTPPKVAPTVFRTSKSGNSSSRGKRCGGSSCAQ